ncbi:hypothetical protein M9H77_03174 [Catharanthus roseus]|uniref:Uncharacterized protein n=1 Tax=Catharanthus roseus TaxID=4058 RepID=A0ACC0CAJ5_CATRO|nr:hypothetical protein M9H77_03174 [Catharanthus roseus]
MLIPQIPSLLLLREKKFTNRGPSTSTRHCSESGPCLSPSMANHPLGPATDHRLGKLLPHQLANQTRAPPRADSSFYSSAYRVLAAVSNCCFPPKGRHNLYPWALYSPVVHSQKYSHPCPLTSISRASSLNHNGGEKPNRKTHIEFRDNQARTDDFYHIKVTLYS